MIFCLKFTVLSDLLNQLSGQATIKSCQFVSLSPNSILLYLRFARRVSQTRPSEAQNTQTSDVVWIAPHTWEFTGRYQKKASPIWAGPFVWCLAVTYFPSV